ncbi:MAG: hypothetical protein OEZ58_05485 [Gammaproteobacteria bacterium]|nr:hypothetical protein [Gammaproteobacteria bacterium]MDH5728418.1 hypothetical protein [Gammaproteobacteria bacterium]
MTSRFFQLNVMGDDQDTSLVFLDTDPVELVDHSYRVAKGLSMLGRLDEPLIFTMQLESPGIKLPSLIGNIMGYLILTSRGKEIVEKLEPNGEYYSIVIINHKGRVHSEDHWIINPLSIHSCLHTGKSRITYLQSQPDLVVSLDEIVLDKNKLVPESHIFRLKEDPRCYVISETLAAALQSASLNNVYLDELEVV